MSRLLSLLALSAALESSVRPVLALDDSPAGRPGGPDLERLEVGGAVSLPVSGALDLTLAGTLNPNAIRMAPGNRISFCPALSCIHGPPSGGVDPAFFDHQRTSVLVSAQTQADAQVEEQTLAVTTTIGTGRIKSYASRTNYRAGDTALVSRNGSGAIYRAVRAGTTADNTVLPNTRPLHAPFFVTDGTVRWQWINDQAIGGKLGVYFETQAMAGSGSTWGFANNFQIQPGAIYENAVRYGFENDFTNNDKECPLGIDCTAMRIGVSGHKSTQAINITTANGPSPALIWALRFDGANLASESHIACDANGAKACLASNALNTGVRFSQAFIADNSTAPVGLAQSGSYTNGIALSGSYSGAQIIGAGWKVDQAGALSAARLNSPLATPASSKAPCAPGDWAHDANFVYTCVAANTWKRAALSSW